MPPCICAALPRSYRPSPWGKSSVGRIGLLAFGRTMLANPSIKPFISVVLPAFNESRALQIVIPDIIETLKDEPGGVEIIVIDDGSTDDTRDIVSSMAARIAELRYLRFSRNFGKEAALTAGLDAARGQAVILMDADGQHPPALIKVFLERWRSGVEIVCGVQKRRADTLWKRLAKRLYYRLMEAGSAIVIPPNAGDFRLLDRKVVDALKTLPERKRFMKGLYAWVGFKIALIPFLVTRRVAGESKYGWAQLFGLGLTGITAFSIVPLRLVSFAGLVISASAFLFGVYLLIEHYAGGNHLPGWATLAVGMTFFSGLQLLALGLISEYLAAVFEEVKQRPLYIVAEDIGNLALTPAPDPRTEALPADGHDRRISA
jgi:glycosyltransferase involved in cell wall biosynthesis